MTEDWSCISQQDIDPYAQICKEAVESDSKFQIFKKDSSILIIIASIGFCFGIQEHRM